MNKSLTILGARASRCPASGSPRPRRRPRARKARQSLPRVQRVTFSLALSRRLRVGWLLPSARAIPAVSASPRASLAAGRTPDRDADVRGSAVLPHRARSPGLCIFTLCILQLGRRTKGMRPPTPRSARRSPDHRAVAGWRTRGVAPCLRAPWLPPWPAASGYAMVRRAPSTLPATFADPLELLGWSPGWGRR
jgi:hypothetical protein